MMDKIKDHLDKIVAASIVVGCMGILVWRLMPGDEQAVNPEQVKEALNNIGQAIKKNKAEDAAKRDYAGAFEDNMGRTEGLLPRDQVAWKFWPQPPFIQGAVIDRAPVFQARLSKPRISLGGVWVGKGTVNVAFGDGDENWRARAILVWRKPAAEANWPSEPLLAIKTGADGAVILPPNVKATVGGYEIRVEDLQTRAPYQYRACTLAVFPTRVRKAVGPVEKEGELKLPEDPIDLLPVSDDLKPALLKLLLGDAQGDQLLGAGPFMTRFSDAVKVELPGDVQIRLSMMEQDEDGKYVRGAFTIRRWIPSLEKWVEKGMVRVDVGKDITGEATERIEGKSVKFVMDACATLLELKVEMRDPPPVVRMVPRRDPVTKRPVQPLEMVGEEFVGPPRRVQLAVVKDKRTGETHDLVAGPDDWWPKGLQIAPKVEESKTPVPATPRPIARPAVPTPATGRPARGAVREEKPEGTKPAPSEVAEPKQMDKPPPDASSESMEAYERARLEAERLQREGESSKLR